MEYGILVGVLGLALVAIFGQAQTIIFQTLNNAAAAVEAAMG